MKAESHDVSWFTPYRALDQDSSSAPCIYFKRNGERCTLNCSEGDTARGRVLRELINSESNHDDRLHMLKQYILYNCCMKGQHRRIMAEDGLLTPLTLRWQGEIFRDPEHSQPVTTRSCPPNSASSASGETETSLERTSRYNLRSLRDPTGNVSMGNKDSSQRSKSDFRPHKERPRPTDSVFHRIQDRIQPNSQNAKDGQVYIFHRASSPGHVKIGWSSVSVHSRLDKSKCGYTPELIFASEMIPYARRAETLAHYELLPEWRKEFHCPCGINHVEWFEVDQVRAKQVVSEWADWMKLADPYDCDGYLRPTWLAFIGDLRRRGQLPTAKTLLEHCHAIMQGQSDVVDMRASQSIPASIREQAANASASRGNGVGSHRSTDPRISHQLRALVERVIQEIIARNPHLDLLALDTDRLSSAVIPREATASALA